MFSVSFHSSGVYQLQSVEKQKMGMQPRDGLYAPALTELLHSHGHGKCCLMIVYFVI